MLQLKNYMAIVRDANNVMIHAIQFCSDSDKNAETLAALYASPNRVFNGQLEEQRIKNHPQPFRYNVGLQ